MNSGMKFRRQKAQKARKGNSSLLPSVPFRGQSAIRKGRDEPPMDTDRHGWDGFLLIRVHPRSSAVQIRNPQSAIQIVFGQTQSNSVKPSQTSAQPVPKGLGFDQPSRLWWCPFQNAQGMVVCHHCRQVGGHDIGNSSVAHSQTQSNPVKPVKVVSTLAMIT